MEPNTSSSPAALWTSHAAILEHGEPSVRDASLQSPAFSPAPPSPGLLPASGSESSWYQQIPPSPAVAVGNGSLSVNAHATSSSQSVPSSSFPTVCTLPVVGYDLFGNPEATAATPLPTLPGGQWQQGESLLSWAAPVLPECPSPGLFGFASEFAAWPSEDTSSFFSPSSAGGLAPQSSDNLVGFSQPSSDSEELEALLQSFRIPSPAVEESPVDAPMPPVEEEEEIDVSAFLVSDPEDQLPNASWTASPQMAGSGGDASASWMVPGNTGNNWPPMLAPAAASTCTMVSTSSGSMACHSGGSSISVACSIVGAMMKPSSSVLPLVPPSSSQGAGASSSSNFNGFAHPSSSSVLAPRGCAHAPNLQGPLLLVKQEAMDVDATARRHPDFISLDDDDEDGFYQDANFGSWGSSSSSWPGSSSGSPSFAPGSWGCGSSSSSPSFAPGSWGSSGVSPGFAPGNWGCGGGSSSPSFAPGSWGDGSSRSSPSFSPRSWSGGSSPSFAPGWGDGSSRSFDGSMLPCFDQSMSIDNYGSSSMQRPIRGKMASISGLPPMPKSDVRASSSNGGTGMVFTDPEMAIIAKDKKLQELLKTDAKKVKRMLYNRAYSATAKVRKVMHTKNLERMIVTLEERRRSLCEELKSLQEGSAVLKAQQMEMQMLIGELEQQTMLKDGIPCLLRTTVRRQKQQLMRNSASDMLLHKTGDRRFERPRSSHTTVVREGLKADIQNLKHLKLN